MSFVLNRLNYISTNFDIHNGTRYSKGTLGFGQVYTSRDNLFEMGVPEIFFRIIRCCLIFFADD